MPRHQTSELSLLDAVDDDAGAIARIYVETWRHTYRGILPDSYLARLSVAKLTRSYRAFIKQHGVLVAAVGGDVVGFCSGGRREEPDDPLFRGEVFTLYVKPSEQRRGIGVNLFAAMLARLDVEKLWPVFVWVLEENAGARRFYEGLGALPVRRGTFVADGVSVPKVGYAFFDVDG